jgi:hypothetical protein
VTRIIPIALASAALLAACGNKSASDDSTSSAAAVAAYTGAPTSNGASAANGSSSPSCPTATDVKEALGFEVKDLTKGMKRYGPMSSCGFAAADENALPGVTVQFTIEPASEADKRFSDMRATVSGARGTPTEPDSITVGERGMAYRTASRTMAAAVKGGQLYSVDVHYGAVGKFGDKQEGTVTLLRKLMGP